MTDLLDRLAHHDPAAAATPEERSAVRMDAALERLLAEPAPARARRAARRRGLAVATLATAACAAGVLAALPGGGADPGRAPVVAIDDASAAAALTDLQRRAAAAQAETGRYAYRKLVRYTTHTRPRPGGEGHFAVVLPHVEEEWIAADGTGVVRSTIDESRPTFPTPQDREDYERSPRLPPLPSAPMAVDGFRVAGFTPAEIAALPTEPAALRARLTREPALELAEAAQLLSSSLTPPEVRSALFAMLRDHERAELEPGLGAPDGRRGLGITFTSDAWTTTYLFDPADGAFLGWRAVGKRELPGRETTDWLLVEATGRAEHAPEARAAPPVREAPPAG